MFLVRSRNGHRGAKKGRYPPLEIVDTVLVRIGQVNPKVSAYCTVVPDKARQRAKEAGF